MIKHAQKLHLRSQGPNSNFGSPFSAHPNRFAALATLLAIAAVLGLTSCAGFTTNASSPAGNPGTPGAGVLTPNPSAVSFGNVAVGSSATQSLSVTNTGTGTVNISQATLLGTSYSVVGGNPTASLAVGQSSTVQIRFAPTTAAAEAGSLAILSDASNSPLNVSLSGTGMEAGLTITPASISFGNVTVGQSSSQNVTLTNNGNASLTITAATISGSGMKMSGLSLPTTVGAGQNTSFSVQFAPTAAGGVTGAIVFTDGAIDSPQTLSLAGSGVAPNATLIANPGSIAFGSVVVGNSNPQTVTLTNTGTTSVTISQAGASGSGFSMSGLALPTTLGAGQGTSFTAQFAPTTTGAVSGSISITSTATNPSLTIAMTGTGTQGQLSASPASVNFGSLLVGSSASVGITLTNTGTASVTISAGAASGSSFSMSGLTTPTTLSPGQNTSFNVKFAPTATGAASGGVSITSNAPGSPLAIGLSGTGVAGQPQLAISPGSVNFGNVQVSSTSSPQTITLTNTGNAALTISAASASGAGFSMSGLAIPTNVNAGQSASFTASFAPTTAGAASGSISITSNAPGSPATIALSGTGTQGQLSANPSSASFGNVVTGNSNSQTITLTNGGTASITITQANVTGAGFSITGLTTPATINAGKSATFNAVFAPSSAGAVNGSVSLVSNAPNSPLSITLSGTGVAATHLLGANPTSLSFGNVNDGSNSTLTVTLTNNGNSSVTISGVTPTGAGFSANGVGNGTTLNPNQSATLNVVFAPTSAGGVSGSVSVASNATNSPASITVTGTGVQVTAHSVGLNWTASSTTGVTGYDVYRGTSPGTYSLLVSSVPGTAYTDSSVQSGQDITYYYVVTAIGSNGVQSGDSNQASATVP